MNKKRRSLRSERVVSYNNDMFRYEYITVMHREKVSGLCVLTGEPNTVFFCHVVSIPQCCCFITAGKERERICYRVKEPAATG